MADAGAHFRRRMGGLAGREDVGESTAPGATTTEVLQRPSLLFQFVTRASMRVPNPISAIHFE